MSAVGVEDPRSVRTQQWMLWSGRIITLAPVLIVLASSRWKLTYDPWYVKEWGRIGWQVGAMPWLAGIQLTAIALLVIPATAILGAVLLTGYLGGAIASYVRIGELSPAMVPLTTALLAWLAVYLREPRLRALLPFRSRTSREGSRQVR